MYSFKLLSLTSLMVATQVVASRLDYTTEFLKGGPNGTGGSTTSIGRVIPFSKDQEVLSQVGNWSNHSLEARRHPKIREVVVIHTVKKVPTPEDAYKANDNAQALVEKHVQ